MNFQTFLFVLFLPTTFLYVQEPNEPQKNMNMINRDKILSMFRLRQMNT